MLEGGTDGARRRARKGGVCVFECKNNVRGGGWGAAESEEGWRVCVKKILNL